MIKNIREPLVDPWETPIWTATFSEIVVCEKALNLSDIIIDHVEDLIEVQVAHVHLFSIMHSRSKLSKSHAQ